MQHVVRRAAAAWKGLLTLGIVAVLQLPVALVGLAQAQPAATNTQAVAGSDADQQRSDAIRLPPASAPATQLPNPLTYAILTIVTVTWVVGLLSITKALRNDGWSLKQALMQEVNFPDGTPPPAAGALPPMAASASRFIALIGTVVLGAFFIAIMYVAIWRLCQAQALDEITDVWKLIAAGATLFLPYGVNRLADMLK